MSIHRSGNTIRTVITTIRMVNHVFARFDIMADQPLSLEHRKKIPVIASDTRKVTVAMDMP